jgi:hypothetical protein
MTAKPSAGRVALLATTRVGRWGGWLLATSLLLFAVVIVGFNTGAFGEVFAEGAAGRVTLAVVTTISVLGTLVTTGLAWLRFRDHSIVVFAAAVFGVLATALLALGWIPDN